MENNGNNDNLEGQVVPNAEIAGGENNQNQLQENTEITLPSFNDQLINWAKENGREVSDVNELLKPVEVEKEVIKEVNLYEDVLDDDDKAYFKFKQETKRGRKEFEALNINYDEADRLQFARERVRKENGVPNLSDVDADDFLANELGIEDFSDLSNAEKIKLSGYAKPIIDERKAEQDKYRQPIENKTEPAQQSAQQEYITLPNGAVMRKADFEAAQTAQQKTTEEALQAVKTVTTASFKMPVDDNGVVSHVDIPYEYHEKDSQKMESIISDVPGYINKTYSSEQGFNHASFAEGLLWSDKEFREKAISDIAAKSRAQAIEETLKTVGNHNFDPNKPLDKQTKEGVTTMSFQDIAKKL